MAFKPDAFQNHLLNFLPRHAYERLFPKLELVFIQCGEVIYESGSLLRYAYFPTNCIASLLYIMEDGASSEISVVGNEGMIGLALLMGGDTMPNRAIIQSSGYAYRLKKQVLKQEINDNGPLLHILLLYTQALITQMAQTAVCNRHHSLDQQLCRLLLERSDRLVSDVLSMTQEFISNILGVRREGVTEAAGKLQQAGLIEYRRGHITVLDRQGMEARACECYQVVKTEFDRLLPLPAGQNESNPSFLNIPTLKNQHVFNHPFLKEAM
ncbi:MAG: Crp/Fnr family transcriptional regulator [Methylococcaceae bacterium]|nr:Crp/Fnr family transcriptional regulator [Methylococcaceae bacterium]